MSKLYLIPNLISAENESHQLPPYIVDVLRNVDCYIVENIRNARRYIKGMIKEKDIDNTTFFELNKHTDLNMVATFLEPAGKGKDIGLISEAGVPCVADPGSVIVSLAHELNVHVVPMVGPSSLLLALMGSGMNGQLFTFHGYLPIDKNERRKKIKELERNALQLNASQLFIETPYRNNQMLQEIVATCNGNTRLCLAVELMTAHGYIKTQKISEWKKQTPELHKKTVVFVLGV